MAITHSRINNTSRSDAALRPGLSRREHDWQLQASQIHIHFFEHEAASELLAIALSHAEPQLKLGPIEEWAGGRGGGG